MKQFLSDNLSSILVGAALCLLVGFIIVRMVHNKKKGIGACGSSCADCHSCKH